MTLLTPDIPHPDDVGWRTSSPLSVRRAKSLARLAAWAVLAPLTAICVAAKLWDTPKYVLLAVLVALSGQALLWVAGSPLYLRARRGTPTRYRMIVLTALLALTCFVPTLANYSKGYFTDPIPLALPATLVLTLCSAALTWACFNLTLALRSWERHEDGFCVACDYDLRSSPDPQQETLAQCPECGHTLGRLNFHNWSIPHSPPTPNRPPARASRPPQI